MYDFDIISYIHRWIIEKKNSIMFFQLDEMWIYKAIGCWSIVISMVVLLEITIFTFFCVTD